MPQAADPTPPEPLPLHIFSAGRHTAMSGQTIDFTQRDVMMTAVAYTPSRHEAPLVVGHPSADAPAYGWVAGLTSRSGQLEARLSQVDPAFAEMVRAGRFKKVSASFYAPDAPNNPSPGVFYLRHVGFLGAQPPAVKGLRAPEFAEGEEGVLEFSEFGEWDGVFGAGLWRSLREWVIGKFGLEEADKALPSYAVSQVETGAQDELRAAREKATAETPKAGAVPAFSEGSTVTDQERIAALQAQVEQLTTSLATATAATQQVRLAQQHARHLAFAEGLTAAARWPVAHQGVIVATLDALAAGDAPVEFGEGESRQPLAEALQAVLAALPQQVEFGEVATGARAADAATGTVSFAAPAGATVSPEGLALHQRVIAYQRAHPGTDYVTALGHVQA